MQRRSYTYVSSPVGPLLLSGDARGLAHLCFQAGKTPRQPESYWVLDPRPFREVTAQLAAYFAGELRRFSLTLALEGSLFQRQVWRELVAVPYGTTVSYGELAERLGKPGAARAVGAAVGANPVAIVVPCHRVLGRHGALTGYSGGVAIKEFLLRREGVTFTAPAA